MAVMLLAGPTSGQAQTAVETAELLAGDGALQDHMGWAVAVDGETAVVSAPLHDHQGDDSGSAYVYVRDGDAWVERAELLPSDGQQGDHAGQNRIALDGDTILIGAHRHTVNNELGRGAVYVFERNGSEWIETAKLVALDGEPGDQFGVAVELDGNTAIVGANGDRNPNATQGSVYVFVREDGEWSQQARLFSAQSVEGYTGFGERLSIDGNRVAVGAFRTGFQGFDSGSAYIFEREGTTWSQQATILPDDGKAADQFSIVAIQGDTLMVGACRCHAPVEGGSVYVFSRIGSEWVQQQEFFPLDGEALDGFGASVSFVGTTAVIGAPGHGPDPAGAAYLFAREGDTWVEKQKLLPLNSKPYDKFGARVASDGKTILIGSRGELSYPDTGSATLFDLDAGFQINAGLNDAWYNPATSGQGFLLSVFPDEQQMFVAWFTYDSERPSEGVEATLGEPGQRWLTAQGVYSGNKANLTIHLTQGGVFDSPEPAASTDMNGYGTMTIEFSDCTEGLVNYEITSLGISGEIPIQRIVTDNVSLCEVLSGDSGA